MRLYLEIEIKHAQLKADIQAAIDEADRGLGKPLDIEAIKSQLAVELDKEGRPK